MKNIRAVFRLIAFSIVALLALVFAGTGAYFTASHDNFLKWKNKVSRWFAQTASWIIGLNITVEGIPPDPPFFLVTNHLSYVDILPFWVLTKGTFIAKNEIKSWPFFGLACKVFGIIFIDRENNRDIPRVNKLIASNLTEDHGIILFPEGTSTSGSRVLPFRAPLLYYPARTYTPVFYAAIYYDTGNQHFPASEFVCWWGNMTFFDHFLNLLKLKSINVTVKFGAKAVVNSDRKLLASTLHKQVVHNFKLMTNQKTDKENNYG